MSQHHVPGSVSARAGKQPSAASSASAAHRPQINASSKKVISARERRERLLAYHTAVRLLQDNGMWQGSSGATSSGADRDRRVSTFCSAPAQEGRSPLKIEHSEGTFSSNSDPQTKLNDVLEAVVAYEKTHARTLHRTITLDFVDKQGNLLIPLNSTQSSREPSPLHHPHHPHGTSSSDHAPRNSPRGKGKKQSAKVADPSVEPTPARLEPSSPPLLSLPSDDILSQVRDIFSGPAFSYFDEKRNHLLAASKNNDVADGRLEPPSDLAVAHISKVTGPTMTMDSIFEGLGGHQKGLWARQPNTTSSTPSSNRHKGTRSATPTPLQNPNETQRHKTIQECISRAVSRHSLATCGGRLKYHRRSSDAFEGHSSRVPSTSPRNPTADAVDAATTVPEWLTTQPAMLEAVAAATDLLMFVLMKSLPACLFAGDEERFMDLLVEEREVLWQFATAMSSTSLNAFGGDDGKSGASGDPLLNFSLSGTCGGNRSVLSASNLDRRLFVEDAMSDLGVRASQRAERSLNRVNANRLFMLIEVEQSHSGSNVSRALAGLPLADLVNEEQNAVANDNMELATGRSSRAVSAAASGPHRRVEKIELERERRKREAMRPPRDPLQAVASSQHCWLSLTTAKLRQMPLHACNVEVTTTPAVAVSNTAIAATASHPRTSSSNTASRRGTIDGTDFMSTPRLLGGLETQWSKGTVSSAANTLSAVDDEESWLATPTTLRQKQAKVRSPTDSKDISATRVTSATSREEPLSASPDTQRKGKQNVEKSAFSHPEQTILPIVELLTVLHDATQYSKQDSDVPTATSICGSRLQEVVGPVELRLLLSISSSYASLIQSLHSGELGTQHARFLERNRDHIISAASEIIVNASIEYLDGFIASPDGHRGLPRPKVAPPSSLSGAAATAVPAPDPGHESRTLLASIRPFGRRVLLSKAEVTAILGSSAHHNPATGGVVIGNEHDAHRAALRLLEQNRAVLHEVIARVKGEMHFLLTGVDCRARILEEEQIAIEKKLMERNRLRKMRSATSPSPSPTHHAAPPGFGGQRDDAAAHHPTTSALHHSHRGSLHFQPKGSDIVGHVNQQRFQAMIDELVGSSSEEEAQNMEAAQVAEDLSKPVFDWQRENFSDRSLTRRNARRKKLPSSSGTHHSPQQHTRGSIRSVDRGSTDSSAQQPHPHEGSLASLPRIFSASTLASSVGVLHAPRPPPKKAPPQQLALESLAIDLAESMAPNADPEVNSAGARSPCAAALPDHMQTTLMSPTSSLRSRPAAKRSDAPGGKRQPHTSAAVVSPKHVTEGRLSADDRVPTSPTSPVLMSRTSRQGSFSTLEYATPGLHPPISAAANSKATRRRFTRMLLDDDVPPQPQSSQRERGDDGTAPVFASLANVVQLSNARGSLIALVDEPLLSQDYSVGGGHERENHNQAVIANDVGPVYNTGHRTLQQAGMMKSFVGGKKAAAARVQGLAPHSAANTGATGMTTQHFGKQRALAQLRAPEHLSVASLQVELMELERSRRRAGRAVDSNASPTKSQSATTDAPAAEQSPSSSTATTQRPPAQPAPTSVTASVVGDAEAAVVEKFKKACSSTMQHLYTDAIDSEGGGGFAWYEQGRPCAAERTIRAAALRGVQQGRFDLNGLTPIAALRLAMSSVYDTEDTLGTDSDTAHRRSPQLMYPRRPLGPGGRELLWTL